MTLGFISTGNSDIWMIWISSQVATGNNTGEIEIHSPYWFPTASSHDYQAVLSLQNLCHHLLLERAETRVTKILLLHKRETTPKPEDMEMNAEFLNPKIFTSKNRVINKCWWQVHKLLVWFWSPYSDALSNISCWMYKEKILLKETLFKNGGNVETAITQFAQLGMDIKKVAK